MLPGAAGRLRMIEDDEPAVRRKTVPLQMIGRGQAGLAGPDDDDVGPEREAARLRRRALGRRDVVRLPIG
jgi:hypothetical protein